MSEKNKKIKNSRITGSVPQELFDKLKTIAEVENRSLNNLFNVIFEEYCKNYKFKDK